MCAVTCIITVNVCVTCIVTNCVCSGLQLSLFQFFALASLSVVFIPIDVHSNLIMCAIFSVISPRQMQCSGAPHRGIEYPVGHCVHSTGVQGATRRPVCSP